MLHHRDVLEAEVHGIVQGLSLGKFFQEELFAYVSLTHTVGGADSIVSISTGLSNEECL